MLAVENELIKADQRERLIKLQEEWRIKKENETSKVGRGVKGRGGGGGGRGRVG